MTQRIFPITMPKWGIEMQHGTITGWHANEGSAVQKGDALLDVETDKIVNAVESPASGFLRHIVAATGATEEVGALIAVLADASVSDSDVAAFVRDFKPVDAGFERNEDGAATASPASLAPPASPVPSVAPGMSDLQDTESRISPIARRIAARLGIDVTLVKGTGRNGRVSKEDVEAHASASSGPAALAADAAPTRTKFTAMRSAIAKRLSESKKEIPHYRVAVDVQFAALNAQRTELNARGAGVSVNDMLARMCAVVLMEHKALNAHLVGDEILEFPHVDLCMAVATETGLMTPIVRAAESKTAAQIGAELRELGARARTATLTRGEIAGGTFTISNLGMFGVDRFDAIINPPQVAILAVGAAMDRVVAKEGLPMVCKVATLTLSVDHRAVDGAVAAKFLAALKAAIESPQAP